MPISTEQAVPRYPAFLNLQGCTCLVVGGGVVGIRKARSLLEAGAAVRLVCPEAAPTDLQGGLEWIEGPYSTSHLGDISLVCAAATPEVNQIVVADAKALGIWVNSASDVESGDFLVPASFRLGNIELAISTNGASPAVAAYLCGYLSSHISEAMYAWVELLATLREEIQSLLSPRSRSAVLRELADPRWLARIGREGVQAVEADMRALVKQEANR